MFGIFKKKLSENEFSKQVVAAAIGVGGMSAAEASIWIFNLKTIMENRRVAGDRPEKCFVHLVHTGLRGRIDGVLNELREKAEPTEKQFDLVTLSLAVALVGMSDFRRIYDSYAVFIEDLDRFLECQPQWVTDEGYATIRNWAEVEFSD